MIVTNSTTITFEIPDDNEQQQLFAETNDLTEWKVTITTNLVSYTKKNIYVLRGAGGTE